MQLEQEIQIFVESNKAIEVKSQDDLSKATFRIKGIKDMQNKDKESYDPIIEKAHASHKEAIGQRDRWLKPLIELEKRFKDAILVFNRKMEEEQRERIRIANERLAKEAEAKKQRLLAEAKESNDAWDKEELKEKAQAIVPVTCDAPGKAIEQDGISIRKTWKARVVDISLIPRGYLLIEANMSALNHCARNSRNIPIPGVEFYIDETVSARS